jgi:ABC-type phosphate/phosphonate transport system permease subunit
MKPNIELHKPNRKSYTIIIWGVFLMLLIAQIFWLGREVEELKTTIEKQEKFNEVQSDVISTILDHLLNEIKKDEGSKFI